MDAPRGLIPRGRRRRPGCEGQDGGGECGGGEVGSGIVDCKKLNEVDYM